MCEHAGIPDYSRRRFLAASSVALAGGLLSACMDKRAPQAQVVADSGAAPVPALTQASRDSLSADQIVSRLQGGNQDFSRGRPHRHDRSAEIHATSGGQFPEGVVLSCMDSRVPAEILFDLDLGDAFNVRVAGNVLSPDVLGSLEYATEEAGSKVIIVMGHASCGAVKGAISDVKMGSLTQLLGKLRPAITGTRYTGERTVANAEYVNAVSRTNVMLTVQAIPRQSHVIEELVHAGKVRIVGAFYDVTTGTVEFGLENRPAA